MFPSLIGRLKRVRYAVDQGLATLFPSLIGRLKQVPPRYATAPAEFPSLIGRLKLIFSLLLPARLRSFHPS